MPLFKSGRLLLDLPRLSVLPEYPPGPSFLIYKIEEGVDTLRRGRETTLNNSKISSKPHMVVLVIFFPTILSLPNQIWHDSDWGSKAGAGPSRGGTEPFCLKIIKLRRDQIMTVCK